MRPRPGKTSIRPMSHGCGWPTSRPRSPRKTRRRCASFSWPTAGGVIFTRSPGISPPFTTRPSSRPCWRRMPSPRRSARSRWTSPSQLPSRRAGCSRFSTPLPPSSASAAGWCACKRTTRRSRPGRSPGHDRRRAQGGAQSAGPAGGAQDVGAADRGATGLP
jgi:hypothetical protein